ncbi:MAG: hypothetical protein ACI92G_001104 [Candidatus Pelagisphaera sp.]|jgi:hypothetical protein
MRVHYGLVTWHASFNLPFQIMKRWSTAILSILAVVLAAYSGYLSMENRSLKRQLVNRASGSMAIKAPVETEAVAEASEKEPEVVEEGRRGRFAGGENLTSEEIMARRKEFQEKQKAAMLERFSDPEQRMEMIESMMGRLDRGYADFFKRLNLPADQIDVLKTLMAEQTLLRMEGQILASGTTEEEKAALKEEMKNERDLLDSDIVALLGEDNAEALKQYGTTLQYRGDVESLERSLSYTESPLSKRQSEGLVNILAKVDKEYDYTYDLSDNRGGRGREQLTKDMVDTYYQERSVYEAALLEEASRVLNDAQLASLAESQLLEYERDLRQSEQQLEGAGTDGGRGFGGGFRGGATRGGGGGRPSGGGRGR